MQRRRLVALALLLAIAACGSHPPADAEAPCHASGIAQVGERIPDCSFRTLDGGTLRLAALRGTPVLINFWASWCPNCVDELPALQKTSGSYLGRVRFLGANLLELQGENQSSARRFAARFGVTYTSILDRGGLLYAHFSPRLFPPTTIFVDASGVIRYRKFGPMTPGEIRANIARYLGVR